MKVEKNPASADIINVAINKPITQRFCSPALAPVKLAHLSIALVKFAPLISVWLKFAPVRL
jgi:hypothetical protein